MLLIIVWIFQFENGKEDTGLKIKYFNLQWFVVSSDLIYTLHRDELSWCRESKF